MCDGEDMHRLRLLVSARMLSAEVDLRVGERHLLAATEDRALMVCGFSTVVTPGTEAMYDEAFPG